MVSSTIRDALKAIPFAKKLASAYYDRRFLSSMDSAHRSRLYGLMKDSQSQLRQDLFVLSTLSFKENGYFVEFGAADGVHFSNSYLLEKQFGWDGILSEPARVWHDSIRAKRSVNFETDCVWKTSGDDILFREVDNGELSTIEDLAESDFHESSRRSGTKYSVKTISLTDLLDKYNAPELIDYLSIDTEGSEFDILESFDFSKYRFDIITCEHNFTEKRAAIHDLLSKNGYRRILPQISRFDDWYVLDKAS